MSSNYVPPQGAGGGSSLLVALGETTLSTVATSLSHSFDSTPYDTIIVKIYNFQNNGSIQNMHVLLNGLSTSIYDYVWQLNGALATVVNAAFFSIGNFEVGDIIDLELNFTRNTINSTWRARGDGIYIQATGPTPTFTIHACEIDISGELSSILIQLPNSANLTIGARIAVWGLLKQ